ncbi:MAG: T9SS type A sorting domain-containing protein [candidate division WOR-3 bacterium]
MFNGGAYEGVLILFSLPLLLLGGDYYGGDGIVEIKKGEWLSGDKINLNVNDSLYYIVSNIGGIKIPQVLGAVPKPMDGNNPGIWAVTFINPTENSLTITQVDISQTNGHNLFSIVNGIKPATGWSLPAQSNVRWTGSITVPSHSAFDFICNIRGTGTSYSNDPIRLGVTTSAGVYTNDTFTTTSGNLLPCVNTCFITNGITFYVSGIYSNEDNQYVLRFSESSNLTPIDSGTGLTIKIPPQFSNITAGVNPDFLTPEIDYDSLTGWTISTSLIRPLQNDSAFFHFSGISPVVGGISLYPIDVLFGQSHTQGAVQVFPPPASGDSGGIDTVSLFVMCPNPMDKNTWGNWGSVLVNPTEDAILVTQFTAQAQSGNIFNNVQGIRPSTGWVKVNQNLIRWSGNLVLPPYSAIEFLWNIKGNKKNANDIPITFTAITNLGNYTATSSTTERNAAVPYANLYYLSSGSITQLLSGISSGGNATFTVRVSETGNFNLASGTTLEIHIPPKWSNVSAPASQPGFNPPTITGDSATGWVITTTTNVVLKRTYRDFQFSAKAPNVAVSSFYCFLTRLINTTTNPNINSICEVIIGIANPSSGLVIDHFSPSFIEPGYSISTIDIDLISRASISELGFLSIYNFSNGQWENLTQGIIDTTETPLFASIQSNIQRYLNSANQILIRSATGDYKIHSLSEDFLHYRTKSFYVSGVDLAPSLVNRGQDSVVMLKLDFISYLGSYGIDTIKIYLGGSGVDGDISAVRLFDDLNHNGYIDPGEPQVGTTQVFSGGTAVFSGNPLFTFSDVEPKAILVVYTISLTAGLGNFVSVEIMNSNDILTSEHLPVPGIYPISSTEAMITQDAPIIHWAYARPDSIMPNGMEVTKISAKVSDPQGLGDIQRVKVDCQPIGGDSVVLMYDDGTHGDSIPFDSIFTRDSVTVVVGIPPGDYYLEIEAMDLANVCARELLHIFIKDIQPPEFNTYVLYDTSFTGPFILRSEITDYSGVAKDSLYYRVNQGIFTEVSKDSVSGGIYYYKIPQQNILDTIYYYLAALDAFNNRGTDPANVPDSLYHFVILPIGISLSPVITPERTYLRISPNPSHGKVKIRFGSNKRDDIRIRVFDVTGRLVRQWDGIQGMESIAWDCTDGVGKRLSSGVYFLVFEGTDCYWLEKLVILR